MPQLVPAWERALHPAGGDAIGSQFLGSVSRAGALQIDICIIFFCVFLHADLLTPQQ